MILSLRDKTRFGGAFVCAPPLVVDACSESKSLTHAEDIFADD